MDIVEHLSVGTDLKVTGSADIANNLNISNDLTVGNNLAVNGTITSNELITTFISSSVIYASGSNVFGDESSDSHQFTGSVLIKDSVVIPVFSSEPAGGQLGQLYYNSTDTNIFRYTGSEWEPAAGTAGTSGTSGSSGSSGTSWKLWNIWFKRNIW